MSSKPFQFTLRQLMAFVTVVAIVCALAASLVSLVRHARREIVLRQSQVTSPETGHQFPATSEIARMAIDCEHGQFDVPQACWDEMIGALSPSQYDPRPCPWKVLGSMDIELRSGGKCHVDLYNIGKDPSFPDIEALGAFSAGPDVAFRKYYRGGYTTKLKAAIERAYLERRSKAK